MNKVPEGWEVKRLEEIASMKSGDGITSKSIKIKGAYPVYGGNGLRGYAGTFTHDGEFILIGRQGALCGNVTRVRGKFYASEHAVVVTINERNNVDWLYFKLGYFNLNQFSEASAQPGLAVSKLLRLQLSTPTISEQKKIAEILSSVDRSIEATDKLIAKLTDLKKALMQELFTKGIGHTKFKDSPLGKIPEEWEVVRQGEVATFFNGRAYKLTEWETTGTPVIRLQNLTGSGKDYYYSNLVLPEQQYCYKGDLLYMWSASFGPHIWNGDKAIFHYHIWKIKTEESRLDEKYFYFLLYDITIKMMNESHGSTMLHVTKEGMERLTIKLPPISEQAEIASILSANDSKIVKAKSRLNKLQDMKKGLMQDLLTGKVRMKG